MLLALTISSYTALALATSPEVREAEQAYRAADAAYSAAVSNMVLPTLAFTGTAYPYGDNPLNDYRFNSWRLNRHDMALNTTLNLNVFNSFQDEQKVRAAKASRAALDEAWRAARQDRALAAIGAFYALDSRDQLLDVARQNLTAQKAQYDQSRDLYENGMKSLADLLKSETDWRSSQLRLVSAETDRKNALIAFNDLLDRPRLEDASLAVDLSTAATSRPDIGADLNRALALRPEAARARASLRQAQIAYEQAVQGILPTLRADLTWNHTDSANFGSPVAASTLGIPNPNYYFGISLSLPVGFNVASQAFSMLQARAQRKSAQAALDAAERQVRLEVAQAFVALDSALQSYELARLKQEIAKRSFDLVASQYAQGSADAIRMNQAQNDFLDARVSLAQTLHDIFIERARYTRAVGDPLW